MAIVTQAQKSTADGHPITFREVIARSLKESRLPWLFILPSALVMAFVTFYPQAYQVFMSFTNYDDKNLNPENVPTTVGLENYALVFEGLPLPNYDFLRILAFNLLWTFVNIIFHVSIGIAIALLLNAENVAGRRFYRAIFVLAWAMPQYVAALVWRNAFDRDFGAINLGIVEINEALGTQIKDDTRWLFSETPPIDIPGVGLPLDIFEILPWSFYALLIANIWFGWPFMMIVATGALQSIPSELYEAADVDGASRWDKFWSITVPLIRPAMIPAIMLGTIWTFNNFNVIYFITGGGPRGKSEILVTQAYNILTNTAILGNYALAAAFSIIVFFVLLIITLFNNYVTGATEAYYDA